ncbi:MAG: LysR family transcriptional regulator [Pseudomonadota bacterium]
MDWENIRYFLTLARSGSLSASARILGVTHVTVGRRIAQLEQAHGVSLFHRRQSGYRLTDAGERLLSEGESVEEACLLFERQMHGLSDAPEGELTISTPETSIVDLSKSLAAFMRAYPRIDLNVVATSENLDLEQLQADVVIRVTNKPPELLVGRCLTEVPFFAYGTREYLSDIGADMQAANWVIWVPENGPPEADKYFQQLAPQARVALRTNSNSQLLAMVRAGAVLGLIAEPVARRYPELVKALDKPLTTFGLWLLTHRDLRNAARVRCFMTFMSERNLKV